MNKQNTVKCISTPPNTTYNPGEVYTVDSLTEFLGEKHFAEYKFTTEDGVDMYVGDRYYIGGWPNRVKQVCKDWEIKHAHNTHIKRFSTSETGNAYVNKPKFVVGKVYRDPSNKEMVFVSEVLSTYVVKGYGFNLNGEWMNHENKWNLYGAIEATTEEWEAALIEEAKRRGFTIEKKVKARIGTLKIKTSFYIDELIWRNDFKALATTSKIIMQAGKWAEIISNPSLKITEEQLDAILARVKEEIMKII